MKFFKSKVIFGVGVASAALFFVTGSVIAANRHPQTTAPAGKTMPMPLSGTWTVDPMHTNVNFAVSHYVISQVTGRFDKFSGTIVADANHLDKSSVDFKIDAASVDTNVAPRDEHLRSEAFFDVAEYPDITFHSDHIAKHGKGYVAHGTFTMHGVAKEIELPFTVVGPVKDTFGGQRFGLHAHLVVDRQAYGVKWNQVMDNGGLTVGNDVDVTINLEAIPAK